MFRYLGKLVSLEVINLDRNSMSGALQDAGIAVTLLHFSAVCTYLTVCINDASFQKLEELERTAFKIQSIEWKHPGILI